MTNEEEKALQKEYNEIRQHCGGTDLGQTTGVDRINVCRFRKLSENFMRQYFSSLHIDTVCRYQDLSESFIRDFYPTLNWIIVSGCQSMSEPFIVEMGKSIDWLMIKKNPKIDQISIKRVQWKADPNYVPHTKAYYYDGTLTEGYEKEGVFFFNTDDCDLVENLKFPE